MAPVPGRTSPAALLFVVGLAFFTDSVLYYLLVPLLPHYARSLGLSQMEVGVLFGAYASAILAGTWPLGRLADRIGRRKPFLWGLVGLGATTLLFAFASSYPLLLLARILQGLAAAATWTSGLALLAEGFPSQRRGQAMATAFAAANIGVLLGPPISGFLTESFGPRSPFLLAAGLALADAAARVCFLRDTEPPPGERVGLSGLLANATVRTFAGAMALGASLWAILESTLPLHLDAAFGMRPSEIGILFAAAALTHTLTSPLMGRLSDRVGRLRVLRVGFVLAALLIPVPAFVSTKGTVALAMAALGVTASFVMSPVSPGLADAVEAMGSRSFGSVFSLVNVAYAVGMMVGPLAGSALVEAVGLRGALVATGLVFALYLVPLGRLKPLAGPSGTTAKLPPS
jgi:MFS transporter, DHA1 family, solute carrier family 18 (vesicular amine transporter), member 1/2